MDKAMTYQNKLEQQKAAGQKQVRGVADQRRSRVSYVADRFFCLFVYVCMFLSDVFIISCCNLEMMLVLVFLCVFLRSPPPAVASAWIWVSGNHL